MDENYKQYTKKIAAVVVLFVIAMIVSFTGVIIYKYADIFNAVLMKMSASLSCSKDYAYELYMSLMFIIVFSIAALMDRAIVRLINNKKYKVLNGIFIIHGIISVVGVISFIVYAIVMYFVL